MTDTITSFYMLLAAGDKNSTRPEMIIGALTEMFPQLGGIEISGVRRIEQYVNREAPLVNVYKFYESVKMRSEREKS
jgi:hypothetical protein